MESNKRKRISGHQATKNRKALLLGFGLDAKDGHLRITRGPNFHLVGGSHETHEAMQETAVKVNEELHKRGKHLEEVEPREFVDILQKSQPARP